MKAKIVFFLIFAFGLLNAQTEDKINYYPESYTAARENFRKKAAQIQQQYPAAHFMTIKIPSKIDTDLTLDILYIPPKNKQRLIIISSGIHGVEGFTGSAIQLMIMDRYLNDTLLQNTGFLFLHALNPYGYKYLRRVTENNVDLNRNSTTIDTIYNIINQGYTQIYDFINPTGEVNLHSCLHACFFLRALNIVRKHSIPVLRQAILQGQYQYPSGLYYGGKAPEPQINILTPILDTTIAPYKLVMEIDLHTGYGKRGMLHLFPNPLPKDKRKLVEDIFQGYHIDWGDEEDFYTTTGDFIDYIGQIAGNKKYIPMTFEYGTMNSQTTIGSIKSLHIMIMENQGFHYGYKHRRDSIRVMHKFMEMYYPSSEKWKRQVLNETIQMFDRVIPRFVNYPLD